MSKSEELNNALHKQREAERAGKKRPLFAASLVGGASLRECEAILKEGRDAAATAYNSLMQKVPSQQKETLIPVTLDFSQDFAFHRDFKTRYASTAALRRRGLASSRQKHFLGGVFHRYAKGVNETGN